MLDEILLNENIYLLTAVQPALQYYFLLNLQIICWLALPRYGASNLFSWPVHAKLSNGDVSLDGVHFHDMIHCNGVAFSTEFPA